MALGLEPHPDEVRLVVEDLGPGIPEDRSETLFERFVQGSRRDTQGPEGSGLGLAIVKTLITLHGGSVSAHNTEDGARFTVTLPRLQTEREHDPEEV